MAGKRSSAHLRAQRDGRERDNNVCQICGSGNHVEGHHIFDHQFGGAADRENIVSLCHSHHRAVHDGLVDIIKF